VQALILNFMRTMENPEVDYIMIAAITLYLFMLFLQNAFLER